MARTIMTPERYEEIKRLLALGLSLKTIARNKKITRRTLRRIRDGTYLPPFERTFSVTPEWVNDVNWETVIKEVMNGHPIKFIWEDVAAEKIGYKAFLDQFHRKFPQYRQPGIVTRKTFMPGERCEVDYAGEKLSWCDIKTGEFTEVPVFIGVLGFSQLVFATARPDATSPNFLDCHCEMYEKFGGVPQVTVPDCLKTGVARCHLYDPDINPSYGELAREYQTAVVPARPRHPKDKALVEGGVKLVMRYLRWIYRRHVFLNLSEINEALHIVCEKINQKKHSRFKESRQERWMSVEKEKLKPLPKQRYEYALWKEAKVHPDSHVGVDSNFYSAPHIYRGKTLKIKITQSSVEIYSNLERVALHRRHYSRDGKFITDESHLPENVRAYHEATPQNLLSQSRFISASLGDLIDELFKENALGHLRRAQGFIRSARKEIDFSGHDKARDIISKAIETMRGFDKIRVLYFKELLERYRKENLEPLSSVKRTLSHENLRHYSEQMTLPI